MNIDNELKLLFVSTTTAFMLVYGVVFVWNSIAYRASLKHSKKVYERGATIQDTTEKLLDREAEIFTRFEALMERAENLLEKFEKERES